MRGDKQTEWMKGGRKKGTEKVDIGWLGQIIKFLINLQDSDTTQLPVKVPPKILVVVVIPYHHTTTFHNHMVRWRNQQDINIFLI